MALSQKRGFQECFPVGFTVVGILILYYKNLHTNGLLFSDVSMLCHLPGEAKNPRPAAGELFVLLITTASKTKRFDKLQEQIDVCNQEAKLQRKLGSCSMGRL